MDVDVEPNPSTSLASTQKPQKEEEDLEIQVIGMSKEDKIAKLVKVHVANHQKFVEAQKSKATQEMMLNLLGQALQKGLYRLQPPAVTSARGDRCYIGRPDRFYVGRAHRYIRTKA
ncbi:hypothetical protein PCANC_20249 [Puccinia coronata f. sp. avenae]|uniref:Uncharacterized protein n=1 Tax=Puccinia coronata f. sp. avenae TaxID=200324 RepID=A0A2N5SHA6_9BASI|nr:hypothetical protein PCANC_20249 [Puccinia coronata f. sp. avenae]